jgi:cyanate lyase
MHSAAITLTTLWTLLLENRSVCYKICLLNAKHGFVLCDLCIDYFVLIDTFYRSDRDVELDTTSMKKSTHQTIMLSEITETLLSAKQAKGISFTDLEALVGRDEVWIAAVFYRQASASPEEASILAEALGLGADIAMALTTYPVKGLGPVVPTDPLVYRFYEIMQVYGMPMKAVIHEKFGDGIMSAIDFTLDIEKEADPKGDRVKVIMSGKFLPYKKW